MPSRRRQRGHIRTLPSGNFQAIVYAGTDPLAGKERYLRETAATYGAAEQALTRLQGQVDEDRHPKTAITVRQAITQWLDVAELEDTTRERYDDLIRLYILPPLGNMLASKLDAELLERFYARLHRCRELCTGRSPAGHVCRPLSSSTTRKIHYIIRGALERAVRWQHLGVNKAAMAQAPSPSRTEPDPPSAEEAAALLNAAWADPEWGLLLWLTMITGSRRGEVSALRWRHVDFDRAILWVHRSNAQTKAGVKEKETKTGQRRKVALDPHTLYLLNQHRELWEQRCSSLGSVLNPDGFVFSPAPDGSTPFGDAPAINFVRRKPCRNKPRPGLRVPATNHSQGVRWLITAPTTVRRSDPVSLARSSTPGVQCIRARWALPTWWCPNATARSSSTHTPMAAACSRCPRMRPARCATC